MPSITQSRLDALEAIERALGAQGPQLIAAYEIEQQRWASDLSELDRANDTIRALQDELALAAATHLDSRRIIDRAALMRRAKQLAAEGVPCVMRGDYVLHAKSGAILAQVAK